MGEGGGGWNLPEGNYLLKRYATRNYLSRLNSRELSVTTPNPKKLITHLSNVEVNFYYMWVVSEYWRKCFWRVFTITKKKKATSLV